MESWCDISGGAETGATYRNNREALDRILLKARLIHDINEPVTEMTMLGHKVKTPVMSAPMANAIEVLSGGLENIISGCAKAGAVSFIGYPLRKKTEENLEKLTKIGPVAWIIKPLRNTDKLVELVKKAEKVGCIAVGVDVDSGAPLKESEAVIERAHRFRSATIFKKIRKETSLPFIFKGIMSVEDALEALDVGANAIIVSNHGGCALDYSEAAIDALPKIVEAVHDKMEVYVDGQFRRGTDILKGIALGARAVLIGRPIIWGAVTAGAEGVTRVINLMTEELKRAMCLTGVRSVQDVSKDVLVLK